MLYSLHNFLDHILWPVKVSALVQELRSPASEISPLSETVNAFKQFVEGGDSDYTDTEEGNLRLLPDAILRFSDLLREVQQRRSRGEEHVILTYTYQFVKILGLCIHENASIMFVERGVLRSIALYLTFLCIAANCILFALGGFRGPKESQPPSSRASYAVLNVTRDRTST